MVKVMVKYWKHFQVLITSITYFWLIFLSQTEQAKWLTHQALLKAVKTGKGKKKYVKTSDCTHHIHKRREKDFKKRSYFNIYMFVHCCLLRLGLDVGPFSSVFELNSGKKIKGKIPPKKTYHLQPQCCYKRNRYFQTAEKEFKEMNTYKNVCGGVWIRKNRLWNIKFCRKDVHLPGDNDFHNRPGFSSHSTLSPETVFHISHRQNAVKKNK